MKKIPSQTKIAAGALLLAFLAATTSVLFLPGPRERAANPVPLRPVPVPAQDAWVNHDYRALVIGINEYKNGWSRLRNARRDADKVGTVLERDYGFSVARLLDGAASRAEIVAALENVLSGGADSSVLIYIAGHGHLDEAEGEGYLIPADGQGKDQSPPREQSWIRHSVLNAMLNASAARHVLVVADTCHSGAFFLGGAPTTPADLQVAAAQGETPRGTGGAVKRRDNWYARTFLKPSRVLLSSGGLDPVPDNGPEHSVFARQLLNHLGQPGKAVFAASDLAAAVRGPLAAITGQACEYGRLPIPAHRGGEFVFYRSDIVPGPDHSFPEGLVLADEDSPLREPEVRYTPSDFVREALLLRDQGATNSAARLAGRLASETSGQEPVLAGLVRALGEGTAQADRREIRDLLAHLRTLAEAAPAAGEDPSARPRVVAVWPLTPVVDTPAGRADARAIQWALRVSLASRPGVVVVDRDHLADILQEQQIGLVASDPRVRQTLGGLLPASLHVGGQVLGTPTGYRVMLGLTETASGEHVGALESASFTLNHLDAVVGELADRLAEQTRRQQPLEARAQSRAPAGLQAGIGRFHHASPNMAFQVVRRTDLPGNPFADHRDEVVGTVRLVRLGQNSSDFDPTWAAGSPPPDLNALWITEVPPAP